MEERAAAAPDPHAGVSLRAVRALAIRGWAAGIAIACLLMIPAPPTAQLGVTAGWIAGIGVQAASLAGLHVFTRRRIGFGGLLIVSWALPIDLGIMQWLAGGWDAPYHELLLPALILGSAALPPRRFAPLAAGVAAIALAPALYAPDTTGLLRAVTEVVVWLFVTIALSMTMARVRGQARLARSDPLTRLANRRALDERFSAREHDGHVLAIGDLDGFKEINDRHGHLAGDACLSAVAGALARSVRTGDQVFRWGGDEFAVLLDHATTAEAEAVIARLESAVLDAVLDPDGRPVRITFGWATGGPGTDLATLTAAADAMLLQRKASGRAAPRRLRLA